MVMSLQGMEVYESLNFKYFQVFFFSRKKVSLKCNEKFCYNSAAVKAFSKFRFECKNLHRVPISLTQGEGRADKL